VERVVDAGPFFSYTGSRRHLRSLLTKGSYLMYKLDGSQIVLSEAARHRNDIFNELERHLKASKSLQAFYNDWDRLVPFINISGYERKWEVCEAWKSCFMESAEELRREFSAGRIGERRPSDGSPQGDCGSESYH
jgi:hypothetical protein